MYPQIEYYLMWMSAHNRNIATIRTTRSALKMCMDTLAEGGRPVDALLLRPDDFYWLAAELTRRGTESRAKQYVGILSTFCVRHGGIDAGKLGIMWNTIQTRQTRITAEDFRKLYESGDDCDRLILALGASMGLRREEIARIKVEDVLPDGIIVHGKGHGSEGKVAVQPMSELVRHELSTYIPKYHRHKGQYLVTWRWTRSIPDGTVRSRCETIARRLNNLSIVIGKKVTPHALRRLFATSLDRQGVPINTICDLMRHTDPATTRIYIERNSERMQAAVDGVSDMLSALVF